MSKETKDLGPPDQKLPKGVSTMVSTPDGHKTYVLDPFSTTNRWPGVAIDSSSFKQLSAHAKLYEQSVAFLHAAKLLCEAAGESGKDLRWSEGSVCYYCLSLATELFLKACISRASGQAVIPTHELPKLMRRYTELLPAEEFQFPTPWALSASEIEQALGVPIFAAIDRSPDQLYRYGIGRDGTESAGVQFFTPGYIFNYICYLNDVWERAWHEISGRAKSAGPSPLR